MAERRENEVYNIWGGGLTKKQKGKMALLCLLINKRVRGMMVTKMMREGVDYYATACSKVRERKRGRKYDGQR